MKKLPIILCAFILVLASCKKKEYPETITGSPEFYVKANIDGQPIMLQAGAFDYYMYSNYEQDADGIYSFVADIKQKNCSGNCPNSLKIEVYDDQMSALGGASNINSSVKAGTYQFVNTDTVNPTTVGYAVTYKSSFNLSAASYSWNFGYGAPSYDALPTHTFATAGVYPTTFAVLYGSNWYSIENKVKVTTSPVACKAQIVLTNVTGNAVTFHRLITNGSGNYSNLWDFGDGTIPSPDAIATHTYDSSGLYLVSLRVIDNTNQDTAYHNYYVNTALSQGPAPNFNYSVVPILSNSPLAKIKVTYTDGSGTIYTSSMAPQTASDFKIVSVEDYKTNEKNQATKKLKITFNCKLFNGASTVDVTGGEAVIAVAYK
jgi:PKD repeat protein